MNPCAVLVGRDAEMSALLDATRTGGMHLIRGEAGIGKSRLLRELAARCEERGTTAFWGRPEVLATPGPYSLIADLVDEIDHSGLGGPDATELAEILSSGEELPVRRLAARVRGLIGSVRPRAVVLLEDLHLADEMSIAVTGHLARAAQDDMIMIAASYRPESSPALDRLLDVFGRDRLARTIDLMPLAEVHLHAMLTEMWGREPSGSELSAIAGQAEGIPFFVEELASSGGAIPQSISRAVGSRLGALSAPARRLVEVSSLIDGAIAPALAARVAGIDDASLGPLLIEGIRAGLLADLEGKIAFRHALMRDAVAASLREGDRSALHGLLASEIERTAADPRDHAGALHRHLAASGDASGAAEWALVEGKAALGMAALEEARTAFGAALSLAATDTQRLHARVGLAEVTSRIDPSQTTEWEALTSEFVAREEYEAASRCYLERATAASWAADETGFRSLLGEARDLLMKHRPRSVELADVLIQLGSLLPSVFGGDVASEADLKEGMRIAAGLGRDDLVAKGEVELSLLRIEAGEAGTAVDLGARAAERVRGGVDVRTFANVLANHAWVLAQVGRIDRALELIEEAVAVSAERVGGRLVNGLDADRAGFLYMAGHPDGCEAMAARLAASARGTDIGAFSRFFAVCERDGAQAARRYLDSWWLTLGGLEVRQAALDDPNGALDDEPLLYLALRAEMRIAGRDGISEAAVHALLDGTAGRSPTTRLGTLFDAGAAALALGSAGLAGRIAADIAATMPGGPLPLYDARRSQMAALVTGDPAERATLLLAAAQRFAAAGDLLEQARCLAGALEAGPPPGQAPDAETVKAAIAGAGGAGAVVQERALIAQARKAGIHSERGRPRGRPATPAGELSAREIEVAVLVAAGATNAEVARSLTLSVRTVEDHLSRAQRRIGVNGRAGVAAWVAKRGLI